MSRGTDNDRPVHASTRRTSRAEDCEGFKGEETERGGLCQREREREREGERECVCVWEREGEREGERHRKGEREEEKKWKVEREIDGLK